MPPEEIGTAEFLKAIWGDADGVAELGIFTPEMKPTGFFGFAYPTSLEAFVFAATKHSGASNVHMGVCLRKPGTKIGWTGQDLHRGKESDISSAACAWVDLDFKATSREEAAKLIDSFPIKPSIIVRSGGGIHVYWLLREPATGADLARVKTVNKALQRALKGDRQSVDLARVLRVPGTMNVKKSYPDPVPCDIVPQSWHPELKYNLSDFDVLPQESEKISEAVSAPDATAATQPLELEEEKVGKICKLIESLWTKGWRHEMALDVAGGLAHAGVSADTSREIVRRVSNAVGGDTDARIKDVDDTYKRFAEGKEIRGWTKLEERIDEEFAGEQRDKARKTLEAIKAKMPKKRGRTHRKSDFEIVKIVKFDSRPARWSFSIRCKDGREISSVVETKDLTSWKFFRDHALEQTNVMLSSSQKTWEIELFNAQSKIEVREAPQEASLAGALEIAINDFLEIKQEEPDDAELKGIPGYDDQELYFRAETFRAFLKERGLKFEDQRLYEFLRGRTWESVSKRVGPKVLRVWRKKLTSSGNGHPENQDERNSPKNELFDA